MITYVLNVDIFDRPEDAPNYGQDYTMVTITKVVIVGKGTEAKKPTVDLQLTDENGNTYLAMTTGAVIEMLGAATKSKRELDENEEGINHVKH